MVATGASAAGSEGEASRITELLQNWWSGGGGGKHRKPDWPEGHSRISMGPGTEYAFNKNSFY